MSNPSIPQQSAAADETAGPLTDLDMDPPTSSFWDEVPAHEEPIIGQAISSGNRRTSVAPQAFYPELNHRQSIDSYRGPMSRRASNSSSYGSRPPPSGGRVRRESKSSTYRASDTEPEEEDPYPHYQIRRNHSIARSMNSFGSRHSRHSDLPAGFREDDGDDSRDNADRFAVMVGYLYSRCVAQGWFKSENISGMGVVSIRMKKGIYKTFPRADPNSFDSEEIFDTLQTWDNAVAALNTEVAIKITSKVVQAIMARLYVKLSSLSWLFFERSCLFTVYCFTSHRSRHAMDIAIDANTRIQVIEKVSHLGRSRKHQYAAFARAEKCLIVWSDEVDSVIVNAETLEAKMVSYVWASAAHQEESLMTKKAVVISEKVEEFEGASNSSELGYLPELGEKAVPEETEEQLWHDAEAGVGPDEWSAESRKTRPMMLYAPIITGLAVSFNLMFVGLGARALIKEFLLDGKTLRFLLLLTSPFTFVIAMFFCISIVGNIWQLFGPVAQFYQNSAFYSGKAPERVIRNRLPHFTIIMPVYKEGLEGVIVPTIESLKVAITTYERQGGTASIMICEDGMQLWHEEEVETRKAYYDRNAIGWVARPKHGHRGFLRKGRFKKASNMNFALAVSLRIEELMDELRPVPDENEQTWVWTDEDEDALYQESLAAAVEESNGVAWAAGNVRIGEYILIIDSDTRVPEDCFLDAAAELDASPECAIIQHESDVMLVIGHYFELGIANFTRRINKAISFCCANGEVAPFVGHNAFMRWSAVQEACFVDTEDGCTKIWSESHVSEDFDMALRLQMKGYTVRWATYSNGGFKEGVSLTCDDELNRWQKYGYGCSELLFYPLKSWFTKGPVTVLFKTFLFSNIPLHSKISVAAYISSYYSISIAAVLCLLNFFLIGILEDVLSSFYLESWKVFLTCIVIFSGAGNICSSIFLYRLKVESLGSSLVSNFKWIFFFFFFFSGMSWHVQAALVAHLVSYNMLWGSTIKEVEISNFFKEVPAILKRFWPAYLFAGGQIVIMIIFSTSLLPEAYRVTSMTAIIPLAVQAACHILYPIVLNPWLMMFSF
ncbi:hypothetical protein [Phaffia rhodozyma]|uniref:Uncharacterized protein n=1 Tax=Phaffia rhodozyma TaxID=264483 RepID=A0A0F7STR3_PHARH|nr:hypothetical protein [Phaffia rhodozyma]